MRLAATLTGTLGLCALGFALPSGYRLEIIASAPVSNQFTSVKINNKGNLIFQQEGRWGATIYDQNRGFMTFYGNDYGPATIVNGFNDNDFVTGATSVGTLNGGSVETGYVWHPDQGFVQTISDVNPSAIINGVIVHAINMSGQLALSEVDSTTGVFFNQYAAHGALGTSTYAAVPNSTYTLGPNVTGGLIKLNNSGEMINYQNNSTEGGFYYRIGDATSRRFSSIYAGVTPGSGIKLTDINNNGLIFGVSDNRRTGTQARTSSVIWNRNGQVIWQMEQPILGGDPIRFIDAIDTDNSALVQDIRINQATFGQYGIWNQVSGFISLPSLLDSSAEGFTDFRPQEMNNSYQIVGVARKNGMSQLVRLNPVPEPATLLALSAGLAGILARRRKIA